MLADVGAQHLLVGVVLEVAAPDVVAAATELGDERRAQRALRAGDEDRGHGSREAGPSGPGAQAP